jgi:hypothetical protein
MLTTVPMTPPINALRASRIFRIAVLIPCSVSKKTSVPHRCSMISCRCYEVPPSCHQ